MNEVMKLVVLLLIVLILVITGVTVAWEKADEIPIIRDGDFSDGFYWWDDPVGYWSIYGIEKSAAIQYNPSSPTISDDPTTSSLEQLMAWQNDGYWKVGFTIDMVGQWEEEETPYLNVYLFGYNYNFNWTEGTSFVSDPMEVDWSELSYPEQILKFKHTEVVGATSEVTFTLDNVFLVYVPSGEHIPLNLNK